MAGKKIDLVRKSVRYLMKTLGEEDRLCLISFSTDSEVLTPFLKNNETNKPRFKKLLKSLKGSASTNIPSGKLSIINHRNEKRAHYALEKKMG
jgi:hypothetical protein